MFTKIKQLFSVERVAVALSPVWTTAGGVISAFAAANIPAAPHVSGTAIAGVFGTTVIGEYAALLKWLHGRQSPELLKLEQDAKADAARVVKVADEVAPGHKDFFAQLEGVGEAELKRVYDAVKAKLPAPPEPLAEIPAAAPAPAGDFVPPPAAPAASPLPAAATGVVPGAVI